MLDTLKNTKRIDILAERQYVKKNDEARGNAMDMKSGKTTTGKPWTLPKIAISEGFSSIAGRWTDEAFYRYPQQYHGLLNTVCSWTT